MATTDLDKAYAIATRATVNALIKHLRESDPDAVEKVRAHAEKEARYASTGAQQESDAVKAVTMLHFGHED